MLIFGGGGFVLAALALVSPAFQVCRDWAFVDENTGSRKGHREWFFGLRSGEWHQESDLEAFMRAKHPAVFRQHWTSYAGTGRNIFGGATVYGHGRPGHIKLLPSTVINDYCASASDAEKRRIYDILAGMDEEAIRKLAFAINDAVFSQRRDARQRGNLTNSESPKP